MRVTLARGQARRETKRERKCGIMHQTVSFLDDVRGAWHLCQCSTDAQQRSLPELLC